MSDTRPIIDPHGSYVPVEHRGPLGLDRRKLWPAMVVLAVTVFLGAGLPAINSALGHELPVEPGAVLTTGTVSFAPASGWAIDADTVFMGSEGTGVHNDGVQLTLRVGTWTDDLDALVATVNEEVEDRFGHLVSGSRTTVVTADGVVGVRESFTGPSVEGEVYVFLDGTQAAQIIVNGPDGSLRNERDAIDAMIRSVTFAVAGASS